MHLRAIHVGLPVYNIIETQFQAYIVFSNYQTAPSGTMDRLGTLLPAESRQGIWFM